MSAGLTETQLARLPKDPWPDSTLALIREGYRFIPNRMERYRTYGFETRLMLEKVLCLRGPEAAEIFYDTDYFRRSGAMPSRVQRTLTGKKGVQSLDAEAHQRRKALFMSFMDDASRQHFLHLFHDEWSQLLHKQGHKPFSIFLFSQNVLFRAACAWAGVPLPSRPARQARWMGEMVDGFGGVGPRHWRGIAARNHAETWIEGVVEEVRKTLYTPSSSSALSAISLFRDSNGALLSTTVAAVEILNILRPITAIATYITFCALALHEWQERISHSRLEEAAYLNSFVEEVRRFYPFTPFVGARAKQDFVWQGVKIPKKRLVILDIYGALHDPSLWSQPKEFQPERFRRKAMDQNLFLFTPQGGGHYIHNHRCAGEALTVEVMQEAVRLLAGMHYTVPRQQYLHYPLSRIPTLPESGFVISL